MTLYIALGIAGLALIALVALWDQAATIRDLTEDNADLRSEVAFYQELANRYQRQAEQAAMRWWEERAAYNTLRSEGN